MDRLILLKDLIQKAFVAGVQWERSASGSPEKLNFDGTPVTTLDASDRHIKKVIACIDLELLTGSK